MSEFTNVDVPKKAIVAQGVIYQASTAMSVMSQAGIPTIQTTEDKTFRYEVTAGNPGKYDVAFDADSEPSKMIYTPMDATIKWTHRPYIILDGAKLNARVPGQMAADSLRAVSEYFAAVRDYETLTRMAAISMTSTAATAVWTTDNADPEKDVVDAMQRVDQNSNVGNAIRYSVVLPAGMKMEIRKLTLIENIQRTMEDYLSKSFDIDFFSYRPFMYKATATAAAVTTVLNGLTTTAMVFVQGAETAMQIQFDPSAGAALGAPLTERARIAGRGDLYTQKMGYGCLPMWDALATYTTATNYKNHKIQVITGVSA